MDRTIEGIPLHLLILAVLETSFLIGQSSSSCLLFLHVMVTPVIQIPTCAELSNASRVRSI